LEPPAEDTLQPALAERRDVRSLIADGGSHVRSVVGERVNRLTRHRAALPIPLVIVALAALTGLRETEPPTAHAPVTLPPMVAAPGEVWSPPPGHSPDSLDIDAWEPARLTAPAVPVVED